jgi:hypothetical protein
VDIYTFGAASIKEYCGKDVRPVDIIAKKEVSNKGSSQF